MNKEEMYQGLRDVGYTEKQIEKLLVSKLTEEQYEQLIEAKAEKINVDNKSGILKFIKVNHCKRAEKFGRLSDGDTTKYMNIALKYFDNRCALSGEEFKSFKEGNVKNSKAKSNLSADHVIALCQGGNDVYSNLVPTVLQYNISKNGYYLLDWWNKQKNSDQTQTLYSPYRLLKLVNYMMKSLDARNQDLSIKEYEKAILTPNEIDEFLDGIEQQDKEETDNSKRKLISDVVTTVEIDQEDEKKILQTIPEMEGNIPKQSEQQREKEDDTMMDIFLYDSIKTLKEDEQLIEHEEFEQLMNYLDEMYEKARGVIPFEIKVRNKILNKLEELGIKENKYTVTNELLQNTEILKVARENKNEIEEYLSQYFEEKEKQLIEELKLTNEQIQTAITNVPSILYDKSVADKIGFYRKNRPDHLQDYLEGNNSATDKFIDSLIILQSIEVDTNKLVTGDTIESLAEKSRISVDQIKEAGLNPEDKIGTSKHHIAQAYRGNEGKTRPTEEQKEELKKLGILLEERNVTQEFIDKIKKLQSIGVDTNKLVSRDTIESLAEKSRISVDQIKEAGLNPEDKIGTSKQNIAQAYRGNGGVTRPTEEQKEELKKLGMSLEQEEELKKLGMSLEQEEELKKLGMSLEKKVTRKNATNATQKFIDKIKKLQSIGVNTNKLVQRDTIESLAEKSRMSVDQIKEAGLNPEDKIGKSKDNIAQAYRGNRVVTLPTEEQKEELKKLGMSLEKKVTRKNATNVTQEFIDKIKKLQSIGVDTNKLVKRDTIESLAEKSRISVDQIKEAGLNPEDKIGTSKDHITQAYRGNRGGTTPTEEQKEELKKLGMSLEKKVTRKNAKSVVVEQKQAGEIGYNLIIDKNFNENFKQAEYSIEKESGDR